MINLFVTCLVFFCSLNNLAFASGNIKIIPYPQSLDITSEGASSAPKNINHEDSIYFKNAQDFFNPKSQDGRIILKNFPTYQQSRENTCGPAAGLMVLYYYGEKSYTEEKLSELMGTKPYPIGTSLSGMVEFFKNIGWKVQSKLDHKRFDEYDDFKNFVIKNLSENTPIMVENVEWGGHWRVIIGYDDMKTLSTLDDVIIMADPYDTCDHDQDGYTVNNGEKFYSMWFDHSMLPEEQRDQPFLIAHP